MPRTNTITKSRSKPRSRSRKSRSKSRTNSRTNSITRNSYKSKSRCNSRRKYRGGCKECANAGSPTWKSTGPMYGGSNHDQISKDIFSNVTNTIVRSVA